MKLCSSEVSAYTSAGPPIPKRVCRLSKVPCETAKLGRLLRRSMVSFRTGILSNYRGVHRGSWLSWISQRDDDIFPELEAQQPARMVPAPQARVRTTRQRADDRTGHRAEPRLR